MGDPSDSRLSVGTYWNKCVGARAEVGGTSANSVDSARCSSTVTGHHTLELDQAILKE
jgi:hypothetical protein